MNAFQKRNFKLDDFIEQGTSCYKQEENGQGVNATKSLFFSKAKPSYTHQTVYYFGQCIFQDEPKMALSFEA